MGDSLLQEFGRGDYKRQWNLMIFELLNGEKLMVPLRLGRRCCYVTVGAPRQNCSLPLRPDAEREELGRGSTSKLGLEQHGVRERAKESELDKNPASAANLPSDPVKVTQSLWSPFPPHLKGRRVQRGGEAGPWGEEPHRIWAPLFPSQLPSDN